MSNKFRQDRGPAIPPKRRAEEPQGDFDGFHGEKSGALLPLNTGAIAEHVTVQRGQLTKDVGWTHLGDPVGLIIGLYEHKWQFGGRVFAKVLRIFNAGGVTRSQYWDGDEWVESAQASEPMDSVYLSEVSIQGCLCLADGERIMRWCEQVLTQDVYHEFEANQHLTLDSTGQRCSDEVAIFPANAISSAYDISWSAIFDNVPSDEQITIVVQFLHNGSVAAERTVRYTPGTGSFEPDSIHGKDRADPEFTTRGYLYWVNPPVAYTDLTGCFDPREVAAAAQVLNNGWFDDVDTVESRTVQRFTTTIRRAAVADDTFQICVGSETDADLIVDSLEIPLYDRSVLMPRPYPGNFDFPVWQWVGAKTTSLGVEDTIAYTFHFDYRVPAGQALWLAFFIGSLDENGDLVEHLHEAVRYPDVGTGDGTTVSNHTEMFSVANVPAGAIIAVYVIGEGNTFREPFDQSPLTGQPRVTTNIAGMQGWSIHPYNFDAGDPKHGVAYQVVVGSETIFELLSGAAPGARFIFSFGDRLIALQDFGDRQSLAWSADGDILEWEEPDSGQVWLLDAQIDPIDDLMAGAHIGGGNFALYRKRSIWRGFETGNVAQAVGVVPWIAGIGTEFRFSVQIIPGGNIFLGSDSMVYILSESGQLTPVGAPILDEIKRRLTAENIRVDYDLVDSLFDSWLQQYWLAIPEDGAEYVTALWIFDLGTFYREGKTIWRKRPMPNGVRRLAAVTMLPEPQES